MSVSRILKSGIIFLVYSNIFIAFCTCSFTARTSLLLVGNNGAWLVNSFVFFATLLFYCFHRMNKKEFLSPDENKEERNHWMNQHKSIYYILIFVSFIALATEIFFMPLRTWMVFIPVGLLGIGYTFPILPTSGGWKRLRDIYWLKTLWIAFAFAWLTTFLPVIFSHPISSILQPKVLFIFSRSFLFLFAICIPFDIRDMDYDKNKGVKTLPILAGAKKAIYISITLLLFFIALTCIQFFYFNLAFKPASALLISALLTITLLFFAKSKRPALFYPLLFDGAMLVQWAAVFVLTHS